MLSFTTVQNANVLDIVLDLLAYRSDNTEAA